MQGNAPRSLAALDQAATVQPVESPQHVAGGLRWMQHGQEFLHDHWFAQNGQPERDALFERRESPELLVQQLLYTTEDHSVLRQKRTDVASEQVRDRLANHFEGQRVATVE